VEDDAAASTSDGGHSHHEYGVAERRPWIEGAAPGGKLAVVGMAKAGFFGTKESSPDRGSNRSPRIEGAASRKGGGNGKRTAMTAATKPAMVNRDPRIEGAPRKGGANGKRSAMTAAMKPAMVNRTHRSKSSTKAVGNDRSDETGNGESHPSEQELHESGRQ
jgi:hypothetical protein